MMIAFDVLHCLTGFVILSPTLFRLGKLEIAGCTLYNSSEYSVFSSLVSIYLTMFSRDAACIIVGLINRAPEHWPLWPQYANRELVEMTSVQGAGESVLSSIRSWFGFSEVLKEDTRVSRWHGYAAHVH